MDTTSRIYTLIQEAERAVDQQRFELARALATIAAVLTDTDARDELAQTVAIYGS